MRTYALDELTWREVGDVLVKEPRLILPVGALEQHGPHLPLGANTFVAHRVSAELSEKLGILRAPTFSYGVTATSGPFGAAAGLRRKTVHRAINELLARWEDQGVVEFVIVSAHRHEPHLEALLMALTATSTTTVYDLYQIDVSDLVTADPEEEHGGELETSLMLHLAPERVRAEEIRDFGTRERSARSYIRGRVPTPPPGSHGAVGRAHLASAEKGRAIFGRYVETLSSALRSTPH